MADQGPSKQNITTIFKRLRSIPTNKQCFDCGANNPTWASVTYGVFLCIDCSAVHRSLGVHLTFIRSTQLDTSWTWLQLRAMQVGGNANATAYFRQHGCTSSDAQQKYNSRAATLYREKLHGLATKALKIHGTSLHIDSNTEAQSPTQKEIDFFKVHAEDADTKLSNWDNSNSNSSAKPISVTNGNLSAKSEEKLDDGQGPNVEAALSTSPTEAIKVAEPRKSTIGGRKPTAAKKSGLGAKKGLGGQKVKANFSAIESQALQKDKDREQLAQNIALQEAKTKEDEEKKMASMRLAYKDLSVQEKKQNEQLKHMDPKKAAQAERLGMGFAGSRGVSHSVMTDMTMIEQERPKSERERDRYTSRDRDFDDFEFISSGFSSGPPKYSDSPFGVRKEDRWGSSSDDRNSSNNWGSNKTSSWDDSARFSSKQTTIEDIPMHKPDDDRGRSRKNFEPATGEEAQKKYGNAKAISSDQFFGNKDPDFEMKQNLSKFEGKNAISSAELFGNGAPPRQHYHGSAAPDLQDIKDGVKQGVTKVAGKISSLTNGFISSIQSNSG